MFCADGRISFTVGVRRGLIGLARRLVCGRIVRSILSGLACGGGGEGQAGGLAVGPSRGCLVRGGVIWFADVWSVWLGVVVVARLVGVVAGLGGPAALVWRVCVRWVALSWGLCLGVVVFRAL